MSDCPAIGQGGLASFGLPLTAGVEPNPDRPVYARNAGIADVHLIHLFGQFGSSTPWPRSQKCLYLRALGEG
jgi:hypothetical protein